MNPEQQQQPQQQAGQLQTPPYQQPTPLSQSMPSQQDNAFSHLTTRVAGDDMAQVVNNLDAPKKIAEFRELKGMRNSLYFLFVGAIFAYVLYSKNKDIGQALLVFGIMAAVGAVFFTLSFISFKQLRRAEKNKTGFNQFQTGTAVTYTSPVSNALMASDEQFGAWLGPVSRTDIGAVSVTVLSTETNNQAFNTLVFTNKQIVGLMLAAQDAPAELAGGLLNQLASSAIQYSDQDSIEKGVQFEALYGRKWEAIMANLLAQSPAQILGQHLNFGIPYDRIQSVEVKQTFINPGLTIHLSDGSKLSFSTTRKDMLESAANYLRQFVQVT